MSLWLPIGPALVLLISTTTGLAAVLPALCASQPPAREPVTVNAGEKESGGKVKLPQGGQLVVTLPSNASTGYEWTLVKHDPKRLKPVGKPEFIAPKSHMIGAGGQQVFRFQARAPGSTSIELQYVRPFQKNR